MKIEWEDATSYRQGERGKKSPTSWETEISGLRIWVSKDHIYYPDDWVMSCPGLDLREVRVGPQAALTDENAKSESLILARASLKKKCDFFAGLLGAFPTPRTQDGKG